jgi:hypothetical protein
MKAPDKIYLNKFTIRPSMLHPAEFPPDNPEEEYIRKGALLEWLQKASNLLKKEWMADPANKQEAFHKQQIFLSVIDKINSL